MTKKVFPFLVAILVLSLACSLGVAQSPLPIVEATELVEISTVVPSPTATIFQYEEISVPEDITIPEELRYIPADRYYGEDIFEEGLYIDPQFTGYWFEPTTNPNGWGIFRYINTSTKEYILRWEQYIGNTGTLYYEFRIKDSVCYLYNGKEFMFLLYPTEEPGIFIYVIGDCQVGSQV